MEEELIKRFKEKRDLAAFDELINLHKRELYSIAKARLKNDADAEDAIQETLFAAFKNIKKLKDPSKFKSWIIRILINNCIDIAMQNNATILCFDDYVLKNVVDDSDDYSAFEAKLTFFERISFLKEEEKTILIMLNCEGREEKEISEILDIREGTLRMKVNRIRKKMRSKYGKDLA